jgi:hypothetical protein
MKMDVIERDVLGLARQATTMCDAKPNWELISRDKIHMWPSYHDQCVRLRNDHMVRRLEGYITAPCHGAVFLF